MQCILLMDSTWLFFDWLHRCNSSVKGFGFPSSCCTYATQLIRNTIHLWPVAQEVTGSYAACCKMAMAIATEFDTHCLCADLKVHRHPQCFCRVPDTQQAALTFRPEVLHTSHVSVKWPDRQQTVVSRHKFQVDDRITEDMRLTKESIKVISTAGWYCGERKTRNLCTDRGGASLSKVWHKESSLALVCSHQCIRVKCTLKWDLKSGTIVFVFKATNKFNETWQILLFENTDKRSCKVSLCILMKPTPPPPKKKKRKRNKQRIIEASFWVCTTSLFFLILHLPLKHSSPFWSQW